MKWLKILININENTLFLFIFNNFSFIFSYFDIMYFLIINF